MGRGPRNENNMHRKQEPIETLCILINGKGNWWICSSVIHFHSARSLGGGTWGEAPGVKTNS